MSLKFVRELCAMTMKNESKFDEELTCQFWPEHSKVINICTLIGYFWPKYTLFELKEVQTSYVWWHWRLVQNLKENWLVLSKMTWRILQIFVHRLKNSYFILESKMRELCENFNLPWKYMNSLQLRKIFTHVSQNCCS